MVSLSQVHSANAALVRSQPLVAVFTAGASGIGSYTAEALAAAHSSNGKGLRAYIVGRKAAAAENVIAECTRVCPSGKFTFVPVKDIALLRDVKVTCNEIVRLETEASAEAGEKPRIDILCMTQGKILLGDRRDTIEGLDQSMSLLYYSRIFFIQNLLPLLLASSLPQGATAISVYAAGHEQTLHADDLSLRQPGNYTFANCRSHVVHMKTVAFERLAREHKGKLSCVHQWPGIVISEGYQDETLPRWLRTTLKVAMPALRLLATAKDECGARVLSLAGGRYPAMAVGPATPNHSQITEGSDGKVGSGAYEVNYKGENNADGRKYASLPKDKFTEQVWSHTMEAFEEIEAGNVFKG